MNVKNLIKAAVVLGLLAYGASLRAEAATVTNAECQVNGKWKSIHQEGGVVWVDGKKAKVGKNNGQYMEATRDGITYSLTHSDDGDFVSWTGKRRANGNCNVAAQYNPQ